MEFYVLPFHRAAALPLFRQLAAASQARSVEAQTNDILLTLMLYIAAEANAADVTMNGESRRA